MTLKIIQNRIPRTIFGIKYDIRHEDGTLEKNHIVQMDRHSEQQGYIKFLHTQPNISEITELRWHIKPDYQQKRRQNVNQRN